MHISFYFLRPVGPLLEFGTRPRILTARPCVALSRYTTPDLYITVGFITVGYELENEKMIGAGLKLAVKDHITAGLWLPQTDSDLAISLSVLAKNQR